MPRFADVRIGQQIPEGSTIIEQADLVAYAGASGDLNPLHWDADVAARVSPTGGIIAHGMLNMGHIGRVVAAWAGGSEHVRSLSATFKAPCPVGATVRFGGEVVALDEEAHTAELAVWATLEDGRKVIDRRRSRAVVQLS